MIVDESADMEYAAWKAALWGFFNSGQTCIRPDYVLIHASKTEEFIKLLTKAMEEWYEGGKIKDNLGHVVNDAQVENLCKLMADHQGQVVYGNANAHIDKNLTPTVVLSPSPDSPMMQGEIFGPILPVVPVANMEAAVAYIQGKDKPLAAYYFGRNSSSNKSL